MRAEREADNLPLLVPRLRMSGAVPSRPFFSLILCDLLTVILVQGAAERTPLFEKRIKSKPKKIRQMFFYFWKAHRMPLYINVF